MKILVPTAGQKAAQDTAEYAMQVALDADVIALHVIKPGNSREAGELSLQYFTDAGQSYGVEVETEFREGAVIRQIIDYAESNLVSLILMGASNGSVVERWLSHEVLAQTAVPVLVMPYQIFDSENDVDEVD